MKATIQRHPRLYIDVLSKSNNNYNVKYYENQYNSHGKLQVNFGLISADSFLDNNSNKKNLYNLNKFEYQSLINLIKKQQKACKIYLNKNKLEQYSIVNSSLILLLKYKKIFLTWFSENKILE